MMKITKSSLAYPKDYAELERRSKILASGIEQLRDHLPPLSDYVPSMHPAVKWVYVPVDDRFEGWVDENGELTDSTFSFCDSIFPNISTVWVSEEYGTGLWLWEDVRPSVSWLEVRLPQMYLLSFAIGCQLGGWSYHDEFAWQYGLSKLIDEAGFDERITRPGQHS